MMATAAPPICAARTARLNLRGIAVSSLQAQA
jgi:hypothetical protein